MNTEIILAIMLVKYIVMAEHEWNAGRVNYLLMVP